MGYAGALSKARLSNVETFSSLRNIGLKQHPTKLDQTQKRELEGLGRNFPSDPNERHLASITTYAAKKQEQGKIAKQMVVQGKKAIAGQVAIHEAHQQHLANCMDGAAKMAEIDSRHAQNVAVYGNQVSQSIAEATGVVAAYRANAQMMNF